MDGRAGFDWESGVWVLVNVNGVLAGVRPDRSIIEPVYDRDAEAWVLPDAAGS